MKSKLLSLFSGLLVVLALPLGAQTLEATYLGINPGIVSLGTLSGDPVTEIEAGLRQFDKFTAFCTDPFGPITYGETTVYEIQNPINLKGLGTIQRILDGFYNHSAQTALDAAGAQWAIWEAIQDDAGSPSFDVGLAQLDSSASDVATRALDYYAALPSYRKLPVQHLVHPDRQDMIIVVPEPAAASLLAATLGLLCLRRRRG